MFDERIDNKLSEAPCLTLLALDQVTFHLDWNQTYKKHWGHIFLKEILNEGSRQEADVKS